MNKLFKWSGYTTIFLAVANTAMAVDPIVVPNAANVPDVKIGNIISAVVGFMMVLASIAASLFLIIGGIQWITSGGDKAGMEAARNRITAAIVGLIIVAATWAIMLLLGQFVGIELLGEKGLIIPTIENPTGK